MSRDFVGQAKRFAEEAETQLRLAKGLSPVLGLFAIVTAIELLDAADGRLDKAENEPIANAASEEGGR